MPTFKSPAGWIAVAGILFGLWIALGDPLSLGDALARSSGLVLAAIALYATGAVREYVTALAFFTIAMVFSIAPAGVVFAGFESNAFWLVLSGLVIGLAINATGLGARFARGLARVFPASYAGLVFGIVAATTLIAFVMPSSMGRVVLLMPIVLAIADRFGLKEGSIGRSGLALTVGFAAFSPATGVLPATVPNMVLTGAMEKIHGYAPLYGEWLILHFPFLGLAKALLICAASWVLFRDEVIPVAAEDEAPTMSASEMRLAVILVAALIGWSTDFLHGISPAWIGMAAAILCVLPGTGVLPQQEVFKKIDVAPVLYLGGVLGLGALIAYSGIGEGLGHFLADLLPLTPGASVTNLLSMTFGSSVIALAATIPGLPAVMVPLSGPLADVSGLPLDTVLASIVLSYSTAILPYQAPPIIIALGLSGARLADATKLVISVAVATVVFIFPLELFWWKFLGLY